MCNTINLNPGSPPWLLYLLMKLLFFYLLPWADSCGKDFPYYSPTQFLSLSFSLNFYLCGWIPFILLHLFLAIFLNIFFNEKYDKEFSLIRVLSCTIFPHFQTSFASSLLQFLLPLLFGNISKVCFSITLMLLSKYFIS